ncbi:MAG: IS110 family transposase [Candidatus Acidiferrales bacterium]
MKNTDTNTHVSTSTQTAYKAKLVKLGIDVHADSYRVVRQMDNDTPQPAQKFTPASFLTWAAKQLQLAEQVHSCYEAGPFGYSLHRQLLKMGVQNVVIRPQNWDELGRKVKTDKTDAQAMVLRLDRYLQGNRHALAVITVPTPAQEQARALSRHREQLGKDRRTHEAQGRSFLLYNGRRVTGQWWRPARWEVLRRFLEPWQCPILENLRALILLADQQLAAVETKVVAQAPSPAKGFGALTCQLLQREVLDWQRFRNRRQVASLTGMCPGVRASGGHSVQGSITKHGNPRVRRLLVELAWRVIRFQPQYPPVQKWKKQLENKSARGGRKKAAVAIGRHLAIDLWRMETGRVTATQLHLI